MAKIVLVGAGGVIFAQCFIRDIMIDSFMREKTELTLMDINQERLDVAVKFTEIIAKKLNVDFKVKSTTHLTEALRGADYVITLFRTGTLEHQELEYKIPLKYGVDQVVSDTLGPGGIYRGLRALKALFEIIDTMEQVCPGAHLLNYVNPMSINTIALSRRAKTVKVVGLCHCVKNTVSTLCHYLGIAPETVCYLSAGVNHQGFILKFEQDGKDLYPQLRRLIDVPEVYKRDKVRFELMRCFDFFPTESSGHGSEYVPYFRKRKDIIAKYCSCDYPSEGEINWESMLCGESGASIEICRLLQKRNLIDIQAYIDGTKEMNTVHSSEYGVELIETIEKNKSASMYLNVINNGLIPSLPDMACVEVPCLVDGTGIHPCRVENYPEQLACLNRGMINAQLLAADGALTGSRHKIFQAVACDPLTAATCSLDEIRKMTDEMFSALKGQIDQRFY